MAVAVWSGSLPAWQLLSLTLATASNTAAVKYGKTSLTCQALIVAPLFVILIAKVLDCLIVDEGVDAARGGVIVCLVHLLAELGAPLQAAGCCSWLSVSGMLAASIIRQHKLAWHCSSRARSCTSEQQQGS